ncbi:GNAT family N-acetyltransferase [Paenibacillus wynnii]|uniref:GNAT family N-acetyltransferase n=1 Tax=Paenibacillus wynnii TaxID=268407 RepID=UPI00278E0101|nr:GNAT family protein [Paenibacillus wynnii]MDQ0196393.1 ribosomal-protein-alanine N-acetyltransferase [Paenibacillus wynnii]
MHLTFFNKPVGIYISQLQMEDAEQLLALRLSNRRAHQRYEPIHDEDFYTLEGQQQLLNRRTLEALQDKAYMFGIYLLDGSLIGQITLSNIVRGVGQFADIGYFMDQEVQSKGYMTAAVGLILQFAFRALALHRVQAAILVHNSASRRVLEKNHFQPEGTARGFIKINGEWQDHQTYAILADEVL